MATLGILLASIVMAAAPPSFVSIPAGRTPLAELGVYRVSYQSYGGKVVHMPPAWTGHFEAISGISYMPGENLLGRNAILLHSPWRIPPGKTWVDYPVRLPSERPLTLSFGIAMKPDVIGKSDGVTFSCYVVDGAGTRQLMRENYDKAAWKDYSFDLAAYAGKDVTLRLQVEPGPANNPSWDYSYFGGAAIQAGSSAHPAALVDDLLNSRALKATAGASLLALSNRPDGGIVPSNLLRYHNTITADGGTYRFIYTGADTTITYSYTPKSGTLDDFTATVDKTPPFRPALGGGVTAVRKVAGHEETQFLRGGKAQAVKLAPDGKSLQVKWEYPIEGGNALVTWRFGIRGKALTVEADCAKPVLSGLSLGHDGDMPLRKMFSVPYLFGELVYLPAQHVFTCRYLDWTVSNSSQCPQGEASYEPKTDGTRNPLHEFGYIAVSARVGETLPNLPHAPSPYLSLLGPRIMLDIWGHHDGTFQGDAENLRDLKDNGVDHLAIISHVWQRYGYDCKLPDQFPANPKFGGSAGMKEFGKAANACGYIWALHENYIDLYPDAPSYDPSARVLRADGTPSLAWYNPSTHVQSFGLKCNRALGYAEQNSPKIHAAYGTTAAYLDVHTCVPPWHELDHDATQPMAAMEKFKVQCDTKLFQYERDTHGGPLFGEGHYQFYWAGRCDGVEGQVDGGEDHAPFLDFDLLKLHPQMVNHGMGYYERWYRRGYSLQWGVDAGAPEQVDKYRAQEIAYGHAGFVGNAQTDNIQWVAKEHHLMYPIQRLMNTAKPTGIFYEVNGHMEPIGVALIANQRLRQHIVYDSGLKIWVNWSKKPWNVQGRTLPQWGFLALGPETEVETIIKDGHFADYANCPEFLFCDARTSFNMPYLHRKKDIEPKLKSFTWLGGNKIRLTYEWIVNDTLDQDYHCFVHFLNPAVGRPDEIAFQQDHPLPKATSHWKRAETIVDGPYDITIPNSALTEYDITIGLFKKNRLLLKGIAAPGNRILIGKLLVHRAHGAVTGVQLGDLAKAAKMAQSEHADFSAHMNPEGTMVDFGTIATDGSVKVNKGHRELIVFPYPRNKTFSVALNLAEIAPDAPKAGGAVRVVALAARTQANLGAVPCEFHDGRLRFNVGKPQAGRYRIHW